MLFVKGDTSKGYCDRVHVASVDVEVAVSSTSYFLAGDGKDVFNKMQSSRRFRKTYPRCFHSRHAHLHCWHLQEGQRVSETFKEVGREWGR